MRACAVAQGAAEQQVAPHAQLYSSAAVQQCSLHWLPCACLGSALLLLLWLRHRSATAMPRAVDPATCIAWSLQQRAQGASQPVVGGLPRRNACVRVSWWCLLTLLP